MNAKMINNLIYLLGCKYINGLEAESTSLRAWLVWNLGFLGCGFTSQSYRG